VVAVWDLLQLIIAAGHRALGLAGAGSEQSKQAYTALSTVGAKTISTTRFPRRKQVQRYKVESKRREDPRQWNLDRGLEGALDPCDVRIYPIQDEKLSDFSLVH
jgi:hypothetical protein